MSPNLRIFLNVAATYGRSLYALILGLFTGRWVLMALGQVDYGLYGVVGGLTVFLAFFNSLLSGAVGRFYAFEIGRASKEVRVEVGIDECRKWFNTALGLHTIVPLVCTVLGYPLGVWAVQNFLDIPSGRTIECIWVFRFVCLSCFISMINVPFQAMYTAKQRIAELTLYSIVGSTLQACFLYYIASHPSDWLVRYAFGTCVIAIVPQLLICIQALRKFPECQVNLRYCWDVSRMRSLVGFAGWNAFGALGAMLRGQGIAILINKYFGPRVNAGMAIANSVNGQAVSLVAAMQTAFTPAIVQACGSGDDELMRKMAYRACKFGMVLALIFVVPLSFEIDNVMRLWLKEPPPYAAGLSLIMFVQILFDKSTLGHMIAVNAKGKIAQYQMFLGGSLILTLPVAWILVELGFGVYRSVGVALVALTIVTAWGRAWFARTLAGMSVRYWITRILLPVYLTVIFSGGFALIPRLLLDESFVRLCMTTLVSELTLIPLIWYVVLSRGERTFVAEKIKVVKWLYR